MSAPWARTSPGSGTTWKRCVSGMCTLDPELFPTYLIQPNEIQLTTRVFLQKHFIVRVLGRRAVGNERRARIRRQLARVLVAAGMCFAGVAALVVRNHIGKQNHLGVVVQQTLDHGIGDEQLFLEEGCVVRAGHQLRTWGMQRESPAIISANGARRDLPPA